MPEPEHIIQFHARKPDLDPGVQDLIDTTFDRLAAKQFAPDPIVSDPRHSLVASVVSSAYKRHGAVIQTALRAALEAGGLQVSDERRFRVSKPADDLAADDSASGAHLPYGASHRVVQIDLMVVMIEDTLGAYEVKRGFGHHDAGKIRSMLRDLRCVRMLLRSYGEAVLGVTARAVDARLISYYGKRDLPEAWILDRASLDRHFGVPVLAAVEEANRYFSGKLNTLLRRVV